MKLFSLLSKEPVHLAPGQKVIPAEDFSTLLSALELVQKTHDQIKRAKRELFIEAEEVKEAAFQEGYQEGLKALNKHLLTLDHELKEIRQEVQKSLLPLALKAARKIMGEELRLHPERIVDIVLNALKPITQHKRVTIYVHKNDLQILEENRPKIKKIFEHLDSFSLQERADIEQGGCIIETEAGIINAQLENQWRALESAFAAFHQKGGG